VPPPHRRTRGTKVLFAVYAALLTALVVTVAVYRFPQYSPNSETDASDREKIYTGTILIPRAVGGDCRQFKFDNNTGAIHEGSVVACSSSPDETNSTQGRMNAIRDAFKK
jgi:hypothetical protein